MDPFNNQEATPLIPNHGIPTTIRDDRKPYQKQWAIYLILATTIFERLAFYGLMTTLSITLQSLESFHWKNRHSKTASYMFSGISYIFTLIFAILSDWKLGRAKTIIIGFALYLIGFILVTITASGSTFLCLFNDTDNQNTTSISEEKCAPAILGTLVCTAIGAGAIKSNLAVFGAEQIQTSKITSRYFDNYAMAVNFGSMIAIVAIPYIHDTLVHYHFIPYVVASSMLLLAAVLFLIGWRFYLHVKSNETVIFNCIPVVINALQSWYRFKKIKRAIDRGITDSIPMRSVNIFQSETVIEASMGIHGRPSTVLDYAKGANGGKFPDRIVNDVKSLQSALVLFTLLIPFWLVYNQIRTTFSSQGEHMRGLNLTYIIPWMSLGDPIIVIIGILIFKIFIYKHLDARHKPLTITAKFVIGMFFAFLSMIVAGIVEVFRQRECKEDSIDSNLSIFVQLLQNILIGFSQLFAMVASYEYAYFGAPLSAQSLFMSLHFCSAGIASFISSIYINYFPNRDVEMNFECTKDEQWYWSFYTYFFILAGLQFIFMIFLIICYKKFRIVKLNPQQVEKSHFIGSSSRDLVY